jgi:hypothetical protein
MDLIDRARRYVDRMPPAINGSGGHNATFHVACVLVQGFGLSPDQALPLMREFNKRCAPEWTENELWHKLKGADRAENQRGRGFLAAGAEWKPSKDWKATHRIETPKPASLEFNPGKLAAFSGTMAKQVDLVWLANRSTVDPATVTAARFLEMLYEPGEKVGVVTYYYATTIGKGMTLWPEVAPPDRAPEPKPCGVWFLNQPLDGEYHPGEEEGKVSCRNWRAVTSWRYMVIESDEADTRQWLGAVAKLPLRISALYSSGGRSVHALVRVDARTKGEWDAEAAAMKAALVEIGADQKALTAVRLTRLPGCWRHGKMVDVRNDEGKKVGSQYERFDSPRHQKLLYINPRPQLIRLADLFPRRDVVAEWCGHASAGIADADETGGAWIEAGLRYYAAVNADCRAELLAWKERK